VEQASWIGPRLHPFKSFDTGSVIPTGFEAYARLDHERTGVLPQEVAEGLIRILPGHTSAPAEWWLALWAGYGSVHGPGPSFAMLTAVGPAPVDPPPPYFALRHPPFRNRDAPLIRLPAREYLLFLGAPDKVPGWMSGPNLWWPDDHAWCVASEIDLPWSYVGGSSQLIGEIIRRPKLNARATALDETTTAERT
jgi:hypothetical protein